MNLSSSVAFFYGYDNAVSPDWKLDIPYITCSIYDDVLDAIKVKITGY
jgi:hypothetical protein